MDSPSSAPKQRFSNRVTNYVRYRPGYPDAVIDLLREVTGLPSSAVVADVGSGTGISAELFLRHGYEVHAVEPNREMREAAEHWLGGRPGFHSVEGAAQATTLRDASVDLVAAAQAFHWFAGEATRQEFSRILKPGGWVALIWNERKLDSTPFLSGYEELLIQHATDYGQVRHENTGPEVLRSFFLNGEYETFAVPNEQHFDYEGLKGRLLSSSYAPAEGQPGHEAMIAELVRLFDEHQEDGRVTFAYDTRVHVGR